MTTNHKWILKEIAELPKKKTSQKELEFLARYLGSNKKYLGARTSDLVKVSKKFIRENQSIKPKELIDLISELLSADTFEEHVIAGKIFTFIKPELRQQIPLTELAKWLSKTRGWVEVDVICQSAYTGKEVQNNFSKWKKMITSLSKSKIISQRRASLVLQIKPVRELNDPKMRELAFSTIDKLKHEKEVLITKAISWILRSLTVQDKNQVKKFLEENKPSIPAIAFRETMKKIETNKK